MDLGQKLMSKCFVGDLSQCWEWNGGKSHHGYGVCCRPSRKGSRMAHRVSWEVFVGPIPSGLNVLHRCDNPPCCNPAHLFIGTQQDNVDDCISKGRFSRKDCTPYENRARGETLKKSHLKASDIREIRKLYKPWVFGMLKLSHKFGVSKQSIEAIVKRRVWKHV